MTPEEILEGLRDVRQANENLEPLLNSDLNALGPWIHEIEKWNRASQYLNLIIGEIANQIEQEKVKK